MKNKFGKYRYCLFLIPKIHLLKNRLKFEAIGLANKFYPFLNRYEDVRVGTFCNRWVGLYTVAFFIYLYNYILICIYVFD